METLGRVVGAVTGVAIAPIAIGGALLADGAEAVANLVTGRPQKARATPFVIDKLGDLIFGPD